MAEKVARGLSEAELDAAILSAVVESSRCEGIEITEDRLVEIMREGLPELAPSTARSL